MGGIIAAPCTGPPLAGILAYVADNAGRGLRVRLLATYAVGIGIPFWALAGFSMSLPRSGPWMESVKSVFGIALFTAALYYVKNILPALSTITGTTPMFLVGAMGLVGGRLALGAIHLSFHDMALHRAAQGPRRFVGHSRVVRDRRTTCSRPKGSVVASLATRRAGSGGRGAGGESPLAGRLHGHVVSSVQGVRVAASSRTRVLLPKCRDSRC